MTPDWITRSNELGVFEVAQELGLKVTPARGANGGCIYGCPLCGAEKRHSSRGDRRGAIGIRRDDMGWRCFECDASGDAVDFAAAVLRGKRYRDLSDGARAEVREWCMRYVGLVEGVPMSPLPRAPRTIVPAPGYPPESEVLAFYNDACIPLDQDPEAMAYARHRGIDVGRAVDRNLVRVLPAGAAVPPWATSWGRRGYRLIAPVHDVRGVMRSVLGRSVALTPPIPKSVAPTGYARSGLIMGDGLGKWLLANGECPGFLPADERRVLICEGEVDWAIACSTWAEGDAAAPATLGIVSGSWTPAIAGRIPDGFTVAIATDSDPAGDRYADEIVQTFAGRNVVLERVRFDVGRVA
jgi:hypothetical protein